jgi:hypothetical protein
MPAMFIEVSAGSGFDVQKDYLLEWVDGARGVVIMLGTGFGDIGPDTAKELLLSDVSAVRYPVERDQPGS